MPMIDSSDISALVRPEYTNEIIEGAIQQSAALQMCRTVRMSKGTQNMPVLDALPTAYWVTGKPTNAENDAGWKQTSNMAWDNKVLTAEEMAVIIPIHENDIADADFSIEAEIRKRVPEAFATLLDAAVLFGTNKPAGFDTGLVPAAIAAGNTYTRGTGSDLADDLNEVLGLVEADDYEVTGTIAKKTLKASLRGLRDSTGQPIYVSNVRGDGMVDDIYGEPLAWSRTGSWGATAEFLAGDFSNAIVGIRSDVDLKVFTEGVVQDPTTKAIVYNLMQQDMIAVRATFRVGFAHVEPITVENKGDANRFPFAVMAPAA